MNAPHFPLMAHMTVKDLREYLRTKRSIILPLGTIEQHGYHLPVATDAIVAESLSRRVGERTGTLVAPTIAAAFSGGSLPGTINISPAVMSLLVSDTLCSLAAQGFRNFYLVLGHGGSENLTALQEALKGLLRSNPAFAEAMICLFPAWKFGPEATGWKKGFSEGDWHAGWLETSLILALAPELTRMEEMATDTPELMKQLTAHPDSYQRAEKIVDDPLVVPRMTERPEIEVGVMGYPERASRELGQELVEGMVADMVGKLEALEARADGVYREVEFELPRLVILE